MEKKGSNDKSYANYDVHKQIQLIFDNVMNNDHTINEVIKLVGSNLVADEVYFDRYDIKYSSLICNYQWSRKGKSRLDLLMRLNLPFFFDSKNKYYIEIKEKSHPEDYSEDCLKFLKRFKLKTLLLYPIKIRDHIIGNLGIVYYHDKHQFDEKKQEFLKIVVDSFRNYCSKLLIDVRTDFLIFHKQLLENFIYPIVLIDKSSHIIDVNSKFESIFKISACEIINKHVFELISNYDKEPLQVALDKALNKIQSDVEIFKIINNEKKIFRLTPFPIFTSDCEMIGIVIKDITKYKVAESKLKKMAFFDSTTGLHNRNYFDQICEEIGSLDYHSIGVIVLDIDNLKVVNDKYGHEAGDHLIVNISKILYEIFNEEFLVARTGGDEFAVFIINRSDGEIKELIDEFNHKIDYHNRYNEIQLCLSIGFDYLEGKTNCILDLINKADENMYINKKKKLKTDNKF